VEGYEWKSLFPKPCERLRSDGAEQITGIDILRRFAVLGILLMNVVGFRMYRTSYDNPARRAGLPARTSARLRHGEILCPYARCALAVYPFRKMSAKGLLIIIGSLLSVMTRTLA
jgi:uncharacterized membrane protein YeiB